jgi:hypothetical protein
VVNWKGAVELFYVLLMVVSIIAIFISAYNYAGILWAAVLVVVAGFIEAILGYILFERVMR